MIKLTGLAKAYDGNQVLNGINLEVKKGDIVVIIGPSGTGKSTLLRCLNLLETRMQAPLPSMTLSWIWPMPASSRP